jgi:hypothetical protein
MLSPSQVASLQGKDERGVAVNRQIAGAIFD